MGEIHVLSFEIANMIAAGEVVERPSSVVKELLENAIDSGADHIVAEIKRGGISLIRVTDNGCGIRKEDLPVALKRHATSKIKEKDDLEHIVTLGFRGEALAAISSVSRVMIITKTADAEVGSMLTANGGVVDILSDVESAPGTTVTVEDLFYNVPARRKFLKKESTESSNVAALVEKVALSRPDISIQLLIDGEERFKTPGNGDREKTVYAVLGKEFASKIIPIDGKTDGIHVYGVIGRSDNVRKNRNLENIFINGRYVKSLTIGAALEKAFTSYIAPECFPACVLFCDMDPSFVDVNVHPAKLEVKFADERPVFEAVYYTVRHALETSEYRPELSLGGKKPDAPFATPSLGEQLKFRPSSSSPISSRPATASPTFDRPSTAAGFARVPSKEAFSGRIAPHESLHVAAPVAETLSPKESVHLLESFKKAMSAASETQPETPAVLTESTPEYRYVGEAFNTYVIVEYNGDLLMIDKHAAHERVIFEDLKAQRKADRRVASQSLLLPLSVSLTAEEKEAVREYESEFSAVGFAFDLGERVANITAIPDLIKTEDAESLFLQMASELAAGAGNPSVTEDNRRERALYQVACKAAIKGGRVYDRAVIDWLVRKLLAIPKVTVCPHGRPVAYTITKRDLDKQFDRIK